MDDLIGLSLWAMALGVYLLPTLSHGYMSITSFMESQR